MLIRVVILAAALAGLPPAAQAQPVEKVYKIGLLAPGDPARSPHLRTFFEALRQLGWIEGQNMAVERRYWQNRSDRQSALARELVAVNVDVIVTSSGRATLAVKAVTRTIPIVMLSSGDAVRQGIVASLARPGGNVTGMTTTSPATSAKRLQLLKEAVPTAARVGVLRCPGDAVDTEQWAESEAAAKTLGLQLLSVALPPPEPAVPRAEQVAAALETATRQQADALLFFDCSTLPPRAQVVELAGKARLLAMYYSGSYARAGGVISYGYDEIHLYRRAALYVDKILRGARPADLPVEQPSKFELVVNLKAARALGLTIPRALLARADQIIE